MFQSFSELFVKFLETESSPAAEPLHLPVDRMIAEERQRAEQHQRAAFNPFLGHPVPSTPGTTPSRPARDQPAHPLLIGKGLIHLRSENV